MNTRRTGILPMRAAISDRWPWKGERHPIVVDSRDWSEVRHIYCLLSCILPFACSCSVHTFIFVRSLPTSGRDLIIRFNQLVLQVQNVSYFRIGAFGPLCPWRLVRLSQYFSVRNCGLTTPKAPPLVVKPKVRSALNLVKFHPRPSLERRPASPLAANILLFVVASCQVSTLQYVVCIPV